MRVPPRTPYDGENMNAYYNNKGNNDEVDLDPPKNDDITNYNYDDFTPDTPTNGENNETIENYEEEKNEKETEDDEGNEEMMKMKMKQN